ncbi:MAG: SMC family ATPase [Actinomycetota bacterium]
MRPIELTLEGFRSYRGKVSFDWRDRRLVGIVGPIGAGKSSILDAIAFALYGKTPGVGRDTKSLIHQLCDQAHVSLTFRVDGQVWEAVRAPKRKGQSGHQLLLRSSEEPDAEILETVTQEKQVNERIELLLGMDFQTFCRSVLLAQNRFADFLTATHAERDRVLKGVFGYERLDAAKAAAERRLEREGLVLASLDRERGTIEEARGRLVEARARADAAAEDVRRFDAAAPQVERLAEARRAALVEAEAGRAQIELLQGIGGSLPPGEQVDGVLEAASSAREAVDEAKARLGAAEEARAASDAELASVRDRLGDRAQLRTFEQIVEQHDELARTLERASDAHAAAEAVVEAAGELRDDGTKRAAHAREAAAQAGVRLGEAIAATADARDVLAAAQHAEMAHELQEGLVRGEPCPVCAQRVTALPKRSATAKTVTAARKAAAKAEAAEEGLRARRELLSAEVGSAETAAAEAERRLEESTAARTASAASMRSAEAELTAAKDRLAERLGDGEPRALIQARTSELETAERAAGEAAAEVETARREIDAVRDRADGVQATLAALAGELASAWGALGAKRSLGIALEELRAAYVAVGEELVSRLEAASAVGGEAGERAAASLASLEQVLLGLGLGPEADFHAERAAAGARQAAAAGAIDELETQLARSGELERAMVDAQARHDLARRLAEDLKPGKFLAFLLEEERAELAELGSGLFEALTDGSYRFAADDSFDILDLNAADRTRKAESLSGGETFLASLALALALAEMVARGGGRLDAFFLDEGFGSLDPEHLDRAMAGIERLVADDDRRLVVLVSHVAEMRDAIEDLIVLDKDPRSGDTVVVSGATTHP